MYYPILVFSRVLLNYLEYKKNSNLDAHVGVFKTIIKVNDEPINEEITKIFNFTLKKECIKLVQYLYVKPFKL
jgi:hypothetical protein